MAGKGIDSKGLILWTATFAGILLTYAAFKGDSPLAILTTHLTNAAKNAPAGTATKVAAPAGESTSAFLPSDPSVLTGTAAQGTTTVVNDLVSSQITNQDGIYGYTDQYGNPAGSLPAVYQTHPASFIPPGVSA